METPEILIVGAGGMGALFGAILQSGGLKISLYDTDMDHVGAMNRNGLEITGFGGDRTVAIPSTSDPRSIESANLLLFQCKAHETVGAARAVRHLTDKGALCISFQNGLGNEEIIADVVGADKVLGGLTAMAGRKLGPGRIRDYSRVPSWIGEMAGGSSTRAESIARDFTAAGLETHASTDIRREIWKKLLGNIAMSALSGATNLTSAACLAIPDLRQTSIRAVDEALAVAASQDIGIDRDEALAGLDLITKPGGTGDSKSSLCVDLLNRRRSEVDHIYGSVIGLARDSGIPVPTLETLASIVKGLESHYLD